MSNAVRMEPMDAHNTTLVNNVHPSDWANPTPEGRYNLVVIGAGTAGLVTAVAAAGLGAKVALIERHLMGGDCLNVGCVPSKGVIRAGRAAAAVRDAGAFGVHVPEGVTVDFAQAMERMRKLRADISHHDSAARFSKEGVDVYIGQGRFLDHETVEVDGTQLKFAKAVICTGARAFEPPIPGLKEAGFLTNETVFSLTKAPKTLLVVGAGPIGCELAQTFQRLGSEVHQVEMSGMILPREDPDAAAYVYESMRRDGVTFHFNAKAKAVAMANGRKQVTLEKAGQDETIEVDEILIGVGRVPNVDGLNLDGVGVEYDARTGVTVDDTLRTTNPRIYAAGDICMQHKFTHAADFAARAVIRNTLFPFLPKAKLSSLLIPWCTYTDPEISHVGLSAHDAEKNGTAIDTYTVQMASVDRAILEGETEGLVKVHCAKGSDKIVGATIVSSHAGESIGELVLAMQHGIGLGKIANVIHPYPTQAEAIRKAGDAFNKTRLTPFVAKLFRKIIAMQR